MAGLHKSPFKGFSVEFAEHRQYGPGDEIRHIDWRAFGKTDRYYRQGIRRRNESQSVISSSTRRAAWATQAGRIAKFEHARRLAASLAYLVISQRDAVGLVTFDTALRSDDPAAVGAEPFLGRLLGARADADRRRDAAFAASSTPWPSGSAAAGWCDRLRRLRPDRCARRGPAAPAPSASRGALLPHAGPRGGRVPVPPRRAVPQPRAAPATTCASIPWPCGRRISSDSIPSARP